MDPNKTPFIYGTPQYTHTPGYSKSPNNDLSS